MENSNSDTSLLRIFIGESDMLEHTPLYEAILYEAKKQGLSGGTVLKGVMSYGASSRLHTSKLLDISQDLPIIVEIIDTAEKINDFSKVAGDMIQKVQCGGLITIEKMNVIYYKPKR